MEINIYTNKARSTFNFTSRVKAYRFMLDILALATFDYVISAYDLKSEELLFEYNHVK